MIVILACVAFAVDVGYICVARNQLQNAADASALASALSLRDESDDIPSRVRNVAIEYAGRHFAGGETVSILPSDVQLGRWDETTGTFTSGASGSTANAVRVTCAMTRASGNPLQLFFARVLGFNNADVTAEATARVKSSRCGLIIGLTKVTMSGSSHTDSYNSDQGPYDPSAPGDNGHVCSNSDITMSGSTAIRGNAHPGPDCEVKSSSSVGVIGQMVPLAEPLSFPPADPGDAPWNNDNDYIPLSDDGKEPLNDKDEFTLSGGDAVDLYPGTYYFSKLTLSGGSSIRISGPTTIFVAGDAAISGGSLANLTYLPKNLQLYGMGSKVDISGGSEIWGVIYAPTAKVVRSSDSSYYGSIVAGELVLSGSGGIHADDALDLEFLKSGYKGAVLVD
jgi:Flp pilus assembly protein TadG